MKSLTKKDLLFLSLVSICFLTTASALYHDTFAGVIRHGGVQVGTVTYKNRYAEQKSIGSSLWASLAQHGPVYNNDTIRTGEKSRATIHFNNKTEISLDEESMIFINIDDNKSAVKIEGGSVTIGNSDTSAPVTIQTSAGKITVSGSAVRVSDTVKGVMISAKSGIAEIHSENGSEPVLIGPDKSYDVSSATTKQVDLVLSEPQNESVFLTHDNLFTVSFSWKMPIEQEQSDSAELDVAKDPSFKEMVFSDKKAANGMSLNLQEGRYYWKIAGQDIENTFTIVNVNAPNLLYPVNAVFTYVDKPVPVSFSWTQTEGAEEYRIDVFRKDNPGTMLVSRTILQRNILLDFVDKGDYFWKVVALIGPEKNEIQSEKGSFSIREGTLTPPVITSVQGNNIPLKTISLSSTGIKPFAIWDSVPNAEEYEIIISSSPDGRQEILKKQTKLNFFGLENPLAEGIYYIKARSVSKKETSRWSETQTLQVLPIQPIAIVSPALHANEENQEHLKFSWTDPNAGSSYRILVSSFPDLAEPFLDKKVRTTFLFCNIPENKAKNFYWKVQLLDSSSHVLSESPISTFQLIKTVNGPEPISPILGKQIDLSVANNITFKWKKEQKTSVYTIRLFRMTGGIRSPAGVWETTNNFFTLSDLSSLALDDFAWDLSSRDPNDINEKETSQTITSYFRIVQNKTLAAPKIRRMISKGEY